MSLSTMEYDLIQKYLRDMLSEKDKILFEENMKSTEFRMEVLEQARILNALEENKIQVLKEKFRKLNQKPKRELDDEGRIKELKRPVVSKIWKYAAVVAALIAFILLWQNYTNQEPENINLFAQYYETLPARQIARGEQITNEINYKEAMNAYRNADYSTTLLRLEQIENPTEEILLYKASCHMELKDYSSALALYYTVAKSNDINNRQTAEWYTSLIFLIENHRDKYQVSIQKILSNPQHLFFSRAVNLDADFTR